LEDGQYRVPKSIVSKVTTSPVDYPEKGRKKGRAKRASEDDSHHLVGISPLHLNKFSSFTRFRWKYAIYFEASMPRMPNREG
jgi:hypothetical protein